MAKFAMMGLDDDDSGIETDMRSSDFGKIRVGSTRIDPMAGLSQVTVLLSRIVTGEKKTGSGIIQSLRGENVPFGSDTTADVIGRFMRTKLSPTISAPLNVLSGEDVVGREATLASEAKTLLVPLAFSDIHDAMMEHGVPAGSALGILSIFGMSVQNHEEVRRSATAAIP